MQEPLLKVTATTTATTTTIIIIIVIIIIVITIIIVIVVVIIIKIIIIVITLLCILSNKSLLGHLSLTLDVCPVSRKTEHFHVISNYSNIAESSTLRPYCHGKQFPWLLKGVYQFATYCVAAKLEDSSFVFFWENLLHSVTPA